MTDTTAMTGTALSALNAERTWLRAIDVSYDEAKLLAAVAMSTVAHNALIEIYAAAKREHPLPSGVVRFAIEADDVFAARWAYVCAHFPQDCRPTVFSAAMARARTWAEIGLEDQ